MKEPAAFPAGQSASLLTTTVQVRTTISQADQNAGLTQHATAGEILSSAGTYGDFSRYMQLFAGVVSNNDETNNMFVRGGNPIENLYIVDRIEVPNINHMSLEGTSGGMVSMIDTASIDSVELQTGGYSAKYPEKLSSVMEIRTRDLNGQSRHAEGDVGIVGAGGIFQTRLGSNSALLISAHRSLLNLFTKDIGLNGVPIYTNAMTTLSTDPTSNDQISVLSLSGVDSIDIHPCPGDIAETSTIATQYSGWRTTNGIQWQHLYSARSLGRLSISDSEQQQHIHQQDQLFDHSNPYTENISCDHGVPFEGAPVYLEGTHDGVTIVSYDVQSDRGKWLQIKVGATGRLVRPDYSVVQPAGQQSELSMDPARSDATSFSHNIMVDESGSYLELTLHPATALSISMGGRLQHFSFDDHTTATPRVSAAYKLSTRTSVHAAFGQYAQMPGYINLLSYPGNGMLSPIRATHTLFGADLWQGSHESASIEAYRKIYRSYPVSTQYPSLSLASVVDTLEQQFTWLPLESTGKGETCGVELQVHSSRSRGTVLGTVAYARAKFAGSDGVERSSNYDYPVVANLAGTYHVARKIEGSFRYGYSTGRPYTPFLIGPSTAQDRPIYDLTQVNGLRAPFYSRLDFQINKEIDIGDKHVIIYAGLENATGRDNFLAMAWMPRATGRNQVTPISQMPRFPNFGIRFPF
ncbi:MAG TPA: TonB-dependent receptor [Acidisarcina sp.]